MIGGFVCQRKVCVNTVPKVELILIYIHSISAGTRTAISPQVALPCSQVAFLPTGGIFLPTGGN